MEYYLPTYDECKAIVKSYDGLEFYESVQEYDGYKISVFNYRLVQYSDFIYPLGEDSKVKSYELRGLTFVFNKDGSLYRRFLLMNKFFNLNQVESTQYDLLKDLSFKDVYDKCDGSIISFIELPNGKILAKSKMMIDNDQANAALKLYNEDGNIERLVRWSLAKDITAVFEYISPLNRVVLKYDKTRLILLRLRDNKTGKYLELDSYPNISEVDCVKKLDGFDNFNQILELYETLENKEGCVVTLEENSHVEFVKCKTVWYVEKHRMYDNFNRLDKIIEMILYETVDDYISQLDKNYDAEILELIDNVSKVIHDFIHIKISDIETLSGEYKGDIKDFAINNKVNKNFSLAIHHINGNDSFNIVKNYMIKNLNKLNKAVLFIETNGESLL